jgi:Protein of unknown function (DUF1499)
MDFHAYLPYLVTAVVVILILIFVPFVRRVLGALIRLAIFIVAAAVVIAGVSMLMNNETIFEKPGPEMRTTRFLTMNSARTTDSGTGSATCDMNAVPEAKTAEGEKPDKHKHAEKAAEAPAAAPSAGAPSAEATPDDDYDELMRRSFPGIPRAKLYDLSKDVVNSLGGWKIVKENPGAGTIDCIYTSRILGMEDDVRIIVESSGVIDVCSRSGTARPDSTSWLRWFPGDLGASIGHIKQFYETLEPKMDEIYKEQQDKENAKKPH